MVRVYGWLAWQSGRPTNGADALEGARPASAGAFELHRVFMPVQPCSDPNLSSPQASANDSRAPRVVGALAWTA